MLHQTVRVLRNADSAAAATGGSSGAGQIDPTVGLANLLSQQASAPAAETEEVATGAESAPPEDPTVDPAQSETPGKEIFPPEDEPQDEGDIPEDEADEPNETEQPTDEPAEFARLSPAERKAALELVRKLQPGEIPRIAKLVAQRHQLESTVEQQAQKIEELEAARAEVESRGMMGPGAEVPEAIAKLKTVGDVQKQLDEVTRELEAVQDFLDANPGDAETTYQIGGKELTRKALIEMRANLRQQNRQLQSRGQQILDMAQFTQAKQRAEAALVREFPVLNDRENPLAKTVRQLMQLPEFASKTNGLELAYIMARGNEVVQAERAKRKGATAPSAPLVRKPQGQVPAKKPLVAGANAAGRTGGPTAKQALETLSKDGSTNSFAALLRASGVGQKT